MPEISANVSGDQLCMCCPPFSARCLADCRTHSNLRVYSRSHNSSPQAKVSIKMWSGERKGHSRPIYFSQKAWFEYCLTRTRKPEIYSLRFISHELWHNIYHNVRSHWPVPRDTCSNMNLKSTLMPQLQNIMEVSIKSPIFLIPLYWQIRIPIVTCLLGL
jgi:hypothetical protein